MLAKFLKLRIQNYGFTVVDGPRNRAVILRRRFSRKGRLDFSLVVPFSAGRAMALIHAECIFIRDSGANHNLKPYRAPGSLYCIFAPLQPLKYARPRWIAVATCERTFLQLFKIPRDHRMQITRSRCIWADITVRRKREKTAVATKNSALVLCSSYMSRDKGRK